MFTLIPHVKKFSALPLVSMLLVLALAGCGSAPTPPQQEAYTPPKSEIQQADQWVAEAATLSSPDRDRLLLKAADIYQTQNRPLKFRRTLGKINSKVLNPDDKLLYHLLTGELAIQQKDVAQAETFLNVVDGAGNIDNQTPDIRIRWHRTRGEAFTVTGATPRSIFEFARASALLPANAPDKLQLHNSIWRLLTELSDEEIAGGMTQSSDPVVAGWYQLANEFRAARDDIGMLTQNVKIWWDQHPQHPASRLPPISLQRLSEFTIFNPARIAVLLPRGGEFDQLSQTLSDGILTAYYQNLRNGGSVPELRFYDTNSTDIFTLYSQAVGDGAQLVLGPLQRDKLAELMTQVSLPVPVMGLNYVEDTPNPHRNLYQFGLSIRDEAGEIARQARGMGYRSALIIAPGGRMGESATDAFTIDWLARGGRIVSTVNYNNADLDYTQRLEPALLIKQSKERATRLKQTLGKDFDFSPRRRGDVDVILLVAYPDKGRQIKPALDYLYANDLPVFATSHIYSGTRNPQLDQDLGSIVFTAMPWITKPVSRELSPPNNLASAHKNLFAMGVDAYKMHQWLEMLHALPENEITGLTGNLSMIANNHIQRRLPWARFKNGRVVAAPDISLAEISTP